MENPAEIDGELSELYMRAARLESAYEQAGRWRRYYRVPQGHIHSSMYCSTCNNGNHPTQFEWITDMSGKTPEEMVDWCGPLLCSVCFPDAPVEWTNYYEKLSADKAAGTCHGSGLYFNSDLPHRTGYYTGNWATCKYCEAQVTLTKNLLLRSHKAEASTSKK